jgi:zinc transport system substrate-binding protein
MTPLAKNALLWILLLLLIAPGPLTARAADPQPLTVFTSLAPVAFVVEQIGGDRLTVHTLIPPGRDPHTFAPTPRQVAALGQAEIYFSVAMSFEQELLRRLIAGNQRLQVVDCSAGIAKRRLDHDHHDHGGHDADQGDPHIWLGIDPLAQMARTISAALGRALPEAGPAFAANLDLFLGRLAALDNELRPRLAPYQGRSFLVFHPSFGYFADSFGLIQEAVEIEGKSPSPQQLAALIKLARAKEIRVIFVQPQFDRRAAERMAQALDAELLALDPLSADIFANLRAMAEKIAASLAK